MTGQLDNELAALAGTEPTAPPNFEDGVILQDVVEFGEDEPGEDMLVEVQVADNEIRIFLPAATKVVPATEPVALKDLFASQHINTEGFTVWVNEVPVTLDLIVPPGTIVSLTKVNKGG
jgi:hypothetical protein